MIELASVFASYSTKIDLTISDNSTSNWMELIDEKSKYSILK